MGWPGWDSNAQDQCPEEAGEPIQWGRWHPGPVSSRGQTPATVPKFKETVDLKCSGHSLTASARPLHHADDLDTGTTGQLKTPNVLMPRDTSRIVSGRIVDCLSIFYQLKET